MSFPRVGRRQLSKAVRQIESIGAAGDSLHGRRSGRRSGRLDPGADLSAKQVRQGAQEAPRRAGQAAVVGGAHRRKGVHRLRGSRRCRQGRHDQGDHRARQSACLSRHRAARPDRAREVPDVHAALPAVLACRRRGRHLRQKLVQPRRRRARHGLLHLKAGSTVSWRSLRWSRRRSSIRESSCSSTGWRSAPRSRRGG